MGRIIVANRRGHQVVEWQTTETEEARQTIVEAERILREARERARDVARTTLGDELWSSLQRQGYLDLPSRIFPGVTYRLRVGRRIEVLCAPGVSPPWVYPFLCINPTYPLPEEEFFAHLY